MIHAKRQTMPAQERPLSLQLFDGACLVAEGVLQLDTPRSGWVGSPLFSDSEEGGVETMRRVRASHEESDAVLPMIDAVESRVIRQAMELFPDHPSDAAFYLGITPAEFAETLKRLEL